MLSRTADHLYWMSRFTERAENLARLLDVTHQMSLVPQSVAAENQNWGAILALNSLQTAFSKSYDEVNAENVLRFMVSDADNPASIYSCLRAARENAHAVRGTLTAETWESCNATWIELREQLRTDSIYRRWRVFRMGQVALRRHARRDLRHHAAGRFAGLHPSRWAA